jgi:hypothetical protein
MPFAANRMNRRSGGPDAPQAKGTRPDAPMTRPISEREAGTIVGTGPSPTTTRPPQRSHSAENETTTQLASPKPSTGEPGGLENRGYKPQPGERSMTKEEYKIQSSAQRNFAGKQSEMNCALQSSQQVIRGSNGKNLTEAEMITSGKASAGYNPQTGTAAGKIPNVMQAEGVKAKNMPNKPADIQAALKEGKGVVSAHDAGKLWGNDAEGGHAVHVTNVVRDSNGKVTHYVINDTGTGQAGRRVTAEQYEGSLLKAPATVTEKPISYGGSTARQARRERAKADKTQQQSGTTAGKSEPVSANGKDVPHLERDRDDGDVSLGGKKNSEDKNGEGQAKLSQLSEKERNALRESGLSDDEIAKQIELNGDVHLFRGSTRGFPGNPVLQRLKITPASVDPVVATLFGIQSKSKGEAIISYGPMQGFGKESIDVGNVRRGLEREVQVDMLPSKFEEKAPHSISVDRSREILKKMGVDLPTSISPQNEREMLENTPRLTPEQVKEYLRRASEAYK